MSILCVRCSIPINHMEAIDGKFCLACYDEVSGVNKEKRLQALKDAVQDVLDADKRHELHRDPLDTDRLFSNLQKALDDLKHGK